MNRHILDHLALAADAACEALGGNEVDGGGDQERLDPHVEETVDGRGGVVRVQRREDQVAGKCRLHPDLGGFEVTDLTDHDHVRVLAQEGPERRCEVEADVLVHLHLVDAGEVELDRVLGGGDVLGYLVQFGKSGVKRNGLAATGRPGDEHHAERLVDLTLEVGERFRLVPKLGHVQLQVALVQKTQNDLLAEEGREHRDTVVHVLAAAKLDLDAAVLRQAALGDVELAHDLDAGCYGVFQLQRRFHHLVEHAVDAVAHPEELLVRLDMDIGRLLLDGVGENKVDQLDDRGVLGGALQRADIDLLFLPDDLQVLHLEVAHDVGKRCALVVELVDGSLYGALGDHDDFYVVAGHELYVVDGEDVGGITHRDDER